MTADDVLERYAATVPGIVGNPFVPHWPHPKQAVLLSAHTRPGLGPEDTACALYGGAAGGGKSDALLMAAAQFLHWPHYRGLILRRTHAEMAKAGAIMARAVEWWAGKADWNGTDKVFRFPSGATIEFGYHTNPAHDTKFQGGEWHFVGFDEITHWPDARAWEWLGSRIRKSEDDPIPLREYCTSNPGGPGHTWVKRMFVGGIDDVTGERIKPTHLYIPATLDDNPSLNRAAYRKTLEGLHPTRRQQLLEGDWSAREPGDYFRAEWFGPILDPVTEPEPTGSVAVRWWDLAASERSDAARTASVRMIRVPGGSRIITHAVAFRATPGKRDAAICRQAEIDGPGTVVGIEIEGGSGGPAQFDALQDRLQAMGRRVAGARPGLRMTDAEEKRVLRASTSDRGKEGRADPVASCLERGYQRRGECPQTDAPWWGVDIGRGYVLERDGLRVYSGPWLQGYLDELEGFPDADLKDYVDATSGAWAWLQAHPAGMRTPADQRPPKSTPTVGPQDVHPDDRPGGVRTGPAPRHPDP